MRCQKPGSGVKRIVSRLFWQLFGEGLAGAAGAYSVCNNCKLPFVWACTEQIESLATSEEGMCVSFVGYHSGMLGAPFAGT